MAFLSQPKLELHVFIGFIALGGFGQRAPIWNDMEILNQFVLLDGTFKSTHIKIPKKIFTFTTVLDHYHLFLVWRYHNIYIDNN